MSGLWKKHDRLDIFGEYELWIRLAVEEEIELVVGMSFDDAAEAFIGNPADAFELVFQ